MRTFWKATLAALSFTAFIGAAQAQPYGGGDDGTVNDGYANNGYPNSGYPNSGYPNNGYANNGDPYAGNYGDPYGGGGGDPYAGDDSGTGVPPGGVPYDQSSGGYCDQWGCPDDYYDLPVYYGSAFYDGLWFDGPLYYRNVYGSRQYWIHGGWHADNWRGARPSWYAQGRTGPALGRDFYRSGSFRGGNAQRGFNRGFDNRGAFNGNSGNASRFDNRQNANAGNASRFGNRSFAAQAAPQGQDRSARSQGQGFQRSDSGRQDRSANRGNFQRSSAARPQVQQHNGGGDHGNGGYHGGGHGRSR